MPKIVAVNASPRNNWNTAQLIREAAAGAEETGAQVEVVNLYELEAFSGCRSCFGCQAGKFEGTCVCKDGLTELLGRIREADGLILGSPIYFHELTSGYRAFHERLCFPHLTYRPEQISRNEHRVPVLFIITSNEYVDRYETMGFNQMIAHNVGTLETFIGPTTVYKVGCTLQTDDYGRFEWTMPDPAERYKRHEEVFPSELAHARELGARLLG